MKNLISFSLWGDNPKYCVGAIRNVELAKEIYPGWICRFYVNNTVPENIINTLSNFENVEIFTMECDSGWDSTFWRFYAASDPTVNILLSRDCDSRLNQRERVAVEEWIISDKDVHIMRDHPWHKSKMMAGMWGVKNKRLSYIKDAIHMYLDKFKNGTDYYFVDQNFLNEFIYPQVKDDSLIYDEFNIFADSTNNFSTERIGSEFVGEVIDENEKPNEEHRSIIK